jgi:hypothetical protein
LNQPTPSREAEALAHEHAVRALDQQASVLDNLRARTGTVIAVTALVATFLGGQALDADNHAHKWLSWAGVAPLIAFALSVFWAVRVLQPTAKPDRTKARADQVGLRLSLDANAILAADMDEAEDEGIHAVVARSAQHQWTRNAEIIEDKLSVFTKATVALLAQVGLWILLLITKGVA